MAMSEEIALSRRSIEEAVDRLCAMVMSALIVVWGQGVWIFSEFVGSGSKDIPKGCVVILEVLMCFFLNFHVRQGLNVSQS